MTRRFKLRRYEAQQNAVCFDCMVARRISCQCTHAVCSSCHKPLLALGTRWRVPTKDRREWDNLRALVLKNPYMLDKYKKTQEVHHGLVV